MGKLQEYYRFFDMFKGKFNDDRFSKAGRLAVLDGWNRFRFDN
ncbi:hypothetical protein [Hallella sp.]